MVRSTSAPPVVLSLGPEGRGDDAEILPAVEPARVMAYFSSEARQTPPWSPLRGLHLTVEGLLQNLADRVMCVATTIEIAPYTPTPSAAARLRLRADRLRRDGFAIRTPGERGDWHTLAYGVRDGAWIDELSIEAGDDESGPRDFDREAAASALAAWGKEHGLMQLWFEGPVPRTALLEDHDALLCNVLQY